MKLGVVVLLAGLVPGSALAQRETVAIDAQVRSQASQVGRELARSPSQTGALDRLVAGSSSADPNALVAYVLRASYLQATEDLKHYASKVKHYNQLKKSLREALSAYRQQLTQAASWLEQCGGSRASCDPKRVAEETAKLEAALVQADAAVAGAPAEQRAELAGLQETLERNRQLIAVTRERLVPQPVRAVQADALRVTQPGFGSVQAALAAPQTFQDPMHGDRRLDLCRVWGAECGQPAADAFCRQRGLARADAWQPAPDIGTTRTLGDGLDCTAPYCDGFASIRCVP